MNKSDISTIDKFKFNNFSSIMFWETNIYLYLRNKTGFSSTFIDVPVRQYWVIALG